MAILSPDEARRMARMEFAIVVQTDLCAFLNAAQNFPNMSKENICLLILQFPDATDLIYNQYIDHKEFGTLRVQGQHQHI